MAHRTTFRNLICMADLFFALSASLFLLSSMEGKTLEGEDQPQDPDFDAIQREVIRIENETESLEDDLRTLSNLIDNLDLPPPAPTPNEAP